MEISERIDLIIAKFLMGTASATESDELVEWLNESNENRLYYFKTKRAWLERTSQAQRSVDESWDRMRLRMGELDCKRNESILPGIQQSISKWVVAASILILVATSAFLFVRILSISNFNHMVSAVSVPFGSRTTLTLPDGTRVWLNSGSDLQYSNFYHGSKKRVVTLAGEAYFDVASLDNSLFVVETSDIDIVVLGTQFNVRSYPDDNTIETTLVSGKIEVNLRDASNSIEPVVLISSQKLTYRKDERNLHVHTGTSDESMEKDVSPTKQMASIQVARVSNPKDDSSWKEGKLVIRSESLVELARRLERFYNVEIFFHDESIKNLRYSGTLDEVTIDEVLRAIAKSSSICYTINKNQIILKKAD